MKSGVGMGAAFVQIFKKLVLLDVDFEFELVFSPIELHVEVGEAIFSVDFDFLVSGFD